MGGTLKRLNTHGACKALLLASAGSAIVAAALVSAQGQVQGGLDCEANPLDPGCTAAGVPGASGAAPVNANSIVVTGSRIARKDYKANSPIVTVYETFLE